MTELLDFTDADSLRSLGGELRLIAALDINEVLAYTSRYC